MVKNILKRLNKKEFVRKISRIFFELLIVFFGVLFAFLASDWSSKNSQKQRFEKTISVLQREITDFITYSPGPIKAMEDSLDQFRESFVAGENPRPGYYREPRASGAPTAAWDALLASGAYELLDPVIFYDMTIYYNRVISANDKFKRYMIKCEEWILPRLDYKTEVFYDGSELKGEYNMLILMLDEIIMELKELDKDAKRLYLNLQKQFPTE